MSRRPVGARDGLLPLLLAVFCVVESQHVAIYEDGGFVQDIDGAVFARLVKVPESFEIQYCKLAGVRSEVFNKLLKVVDTSIDDSRDPDLIDVVRPLVSFAASLPDYSRNTTKLGKNALAVRDALMNAEEPATLLFVELPKACGIPKIPSTRNIEAKVIQRYVRTLKRALGELRGHYPSLLDRIEQALAKEFKTKLRGEKLRKKLARRGQDLAVHVSEAGLKAFVLRLADDKLSHDMWIESLGSLVATKPPKRWYDQDEPRFHQALIELVVRFHETASLAYPKGVSTSGSVRLSLLQSNGVERSCVLDFPASQETQAAKLEKEMEVLFKKDQELAMAVAAKVLLKFIGK